MTRGGYGSGVIPLSYSLDSSVSLQEGLSARWCNLCYLYVHCPPDFWSIVSHLDATVQGIPDLGRCGESPWIIRWPLHILPLREVLPTSKRGMGQILRPNSCGWLMGFRSPDCIDPSTRITYPTAKMKTTSKQAESSYKLRHNSSQSPLRPIRSLRRGPSAWVTCGMSGKSCLGWVETVMRRTDRTDIFTYCGCISSENVLTRKLDRRNNVRVLSVVVYCRQPVTDPGAAISTDDAAKPSVLPS